jgi:hypothetical protein
MLPTHRRTIEVFWEASLYIGYVYSMQMFRDYVVAKCRSLSGVLCHTPCRPERRLTPSCAILVSMPIEPAELQPGALEARRPHHHTISAFQQSGLIVGTQPIGEIPCRRWVCIGWGWITLTCWNVLGLGTGNSEAQLQVPRCRMHGCLTLSQAT